MVKLIQLKHQFVTGAVIVSYSIKTHYVKIKNRILETKTVFMVFVYWIKISFVCIYSQGNVVLYRFLARFSSCFATKQGWSSPFGNNCKKQANVKKNIVKFTYLKKVTKTIYTDTIPENISKRNQNTKHFMKYLV